MTYEEKTLEQEIIYRGKIINLIRKKVTTINGSSTREIIEHKGGSVIAALTKDEKLVMVKQFRKPAERVMLELPAGKRDGEEKAEEVALRELREETGYVAGKITHLTDFYTTPGYSTEKLSLFLAEELSPGETDFDENEAIDIVEMPLKELVGMVLRGEIEDGKTQLGILMTAEIIRER